MPSRPVRPLALVMALGLASLACLNGPTTPAPDAPAAVTAAASPVPATATTAPPAPTTPPSPTPAPSPTTAPTAPPTPAACQPAEPQAISFTAADGQVLAGRYYPPADTSAPLVVAMHWAGGTQDDWNALAPWMQNRGLTDTVLFQGGEISATLPSAPWRDASQFPPAPAGQGFGVFTFTFRGCTGEDGCLTFDEKGWQADIEAALRQARELPCVNPNRILTFGSSIGADGAALGCAWLNEQNPGACPAAIALSPGGFLGTPLEYAAQRLAAGNPEAKLYCLADQIEGKLCQTVGAKHPNVETFIIENGGHGNLLIRPETTFWEIFNELLWRYWLAGG